MRRAARSKTGGGKRVSGSFSIEAERAHPISHAVTLSIRRGQRDKRAIDFNEGDGQPADTMRQRQTCGADTSAKIDSMLNIRLPARERETAAANKMAS